LTRKEWFAVASKSPAELASENGKPAKNSSPPVIRRLEYATEDGRTRLLKRQVPAWIISGLVHVILIAGYILIQSFFPDKTAEAKDQDKPFVTKVDPADDPKEDLTNTDPGLDPDLMAAVEVDREDQQVVVDAKVVDGEPNGIPTHENEVASVTQDQGPLTGDTSPVGNIGQMDQGLLKAGDGGGGNPFAVEGLKGRSGATREKALRAYGGNDETERAVALGLAWIAKQQKSDGHWEYDGASAASHVAATGMSLLPFLAAGETHKYGKKYTKTVAKGLDWLMKQVGPNGQFPGAGNYEQAIGALPLCEAAGMTDDKNVKEKAKLACTYIMGCQDDNGSWGYAGKSAGDTSIVGWQVQALKSASLAKVMVVPDDVFKKADRFLETVSSESGSQYGYRTPGASERLTAVGHLSRYYLGRWSPKQPGYARGIKWMWETAKPTVQDMYYTYYASQVFHFFEGPAWHKDWNPAMQKALLPTQITEKTKNAKPGDIGSWNPDKGTIGSACGRLGTTCLCVLTLEVFYRHLPLYKRDGGALPIVEAGAKKEK
jgi:hypothetical protein